MGMQTEIKESLKDRLISKGQAKVMFLLGLWRVKLFKGCNSLPRAKEELT